MCCTYLWIIQLLNFFKKGRANFDSNQPKNVWFSDGKMKADFKNYCIAQQFLNNNILINNNIYDDNEILAYKHHF